jgi:hypothetical protein
LTADRNFIPILQPPPTDQRLAVDDRSVAALEILDEDPFAGAGDCRVLPADGRRIEDDLAARMPADQGPSVGERKPRGTAAGGLEFEERHVEMRKECRSRGELRRRPSGQGILWLELPFVAAAGNLAIAFLMGNGVTVARLALNQLV